MDKERDHECCRELWKQWTDANTVLQERSEECNEQMVKGMWTVVISANALRGPRGLHKLTANPKN